MSTQNLFVELLVEELPPKSLKKLGGAFAELLSASLKAQGLAAGDARVTAYATPRRLAVHIADVAAQAADKAVTQKLMPVAVGLDKEGNATPALLKKLANVGADASVIPKLKRALDGKTETLFFDNTVRGVTLGAGLQKALDETIAKLPIPKVMSYQLADGWHSVNFVRPAHGLVALHGDQVVATGAAHPQTEPAIAVLGLTAGRETQGHRFEASVNPLAITSADSYEEQLEKEGAVIASFAKRRADIVRQIAAIAATEKLAPITDDALLDEVTALVERPNVLLGTFEKEFLQVPQECLILTMKANQKYFPLLDGAGKLTHKFLIVANISPQDASQVISGNERVVRPRLADAKFFFEQDRKKPLASRLAGLDKIVYHNKLGSQGARTLRVRAIAAAIAQQLAQTNAALTPSPAGRERVGEREGVNSATLSPTLSRERERGLAPDTAQDTLATYADQAAMLAKADLTTDMVGEFPELQGIMGRYYAQAEGISDEVAYAIEDHYKPRFAGDELPRNQVGICVALADKLETLVGMFGIGQVPTGDKDPFALRRHALGVIRMLIEKKLALHLEQLISFAWESFPAGLLSQSQAEVTKFIFERIEGYLREQSYTANEVDAVLSLRPERIFHIPRLLAAVRAFAALPEADSLAAANKRVGNILKKSEGSVNGAINPALLKEPAEIALHQSLSEIAPEANAAFEKQDYTASLQMLAALKTPIDDFFDQVMVNAEDTNLRNNRLALLSQLQQTMNRVADLSKLVT